MDRLEAMSILVATVECGSLSGAGRRLGVPLATVSRKLSELEAHLRTRLLNRSTRRLDLTDAGRSYLAACKRILDDVGEAERTAAGEYRMPRGSLTITAPIVFGRLHVLPVVTAFLVAYPEVDVTLVQSDRMVDLLEDHIDLAVRIGTLPDSGLVATRVGEIGRVVCASPGYLARRGVPANPADLTGHDCVTFNGLMSPERWMFGADNALTAVPVRSRLAVDTAEAAIDAAIAGVGLTRVLSYQVAKPLRAGVLVPVLADHDAQAIPLTTHHFSKLPRVVVAGRGAEGRTGCAADRA